MDYLPCVCVHAPLIPSSSSSSSFSTTFFVTVTECPVWVCPKTSSTHRKENQFPWTLSSSSSSLSSNKTRAKIITILLWQQKQHHHHANSQQKTERMKDSKWKNRKARKKNESVRHWQRWRLCLRHQTTTEYNVNYNDIIPLKHNSLVHSTIFCIFDLFSSPFFPTCSLPPFLRRVYNACLNARVRNHPYLHARLHTQNSTTANGNERERERQRMEMKMEMKFQRIYTL